MPARLFHCDIMNKGQGPLTQVNDFKDSGDWSDGLGPSESARVINPGEIKMFQLKEDL